MSKRDLVRLIEIVNDKVDALVEDYQANIKKQSELVEFTKETAYKVLILEQILIEYNIIDMEELDSIVNNYKHGIDQ